MTEETIDHIGWNGSKVLECLGWWSIDTALIIDNVVVHVVKVIFRVIEHRQSANTWVLVVGTGPRFGFLIIDSLDDWFISRGQLVVISWYLSLNLERIVRSV
jgi:hypothetical protein